MIDCFRIQLLRSLLSAVIDRLCRPSQQGLNKSGGRGKKCSGARAGIDEKAKSDSIKLGRRKLLICMMQCITRPQSCNRRMEVRPSLADGRMERYPNLNPGEETRALMERWCAQSRSTSTHGPPCGTSASAIFPLTPISPLCVGHAHGMRCPCHALARSCGLLLHTTGLHNLQLLSPLRSGASRRSGPASPHLRALMPSSILSKAVPSVSMLSAYEMRMHRPSPNASPGISATKLCSIR